MTTPPPPPPKNTALGVLFLRDVPFWTARPWLRRLALLVYAYVVILLMLLFLETRLLHPGSWADKEVSPPPPGATDLTVTLADGTPIRARWHEPPGWSPADGAILLSHGNGGNLSHRDWQADLWRKHGFKQGMLVYDYPGYGNSGGAPVESALYAAGDACHAWLVKEKKVAARDIILLGESLGGAITIDMATRLPHKAVITMGAFTSFPDMAQYRFPWLPARWLVRNQLNNLAKVPKVRLFIAHGTADPVIPPGHGPRLHAAAAEGSRLMMIERLGHSPPTGADFFAAVRGFLESCDSRRAAPREGAE